MMTNRPNGALYTGVTSDIGRRAYGAGKASRRGSRNDTD